MKPIIVKTVSSIPGAMQALPAPNELAILTLDHDEEVARQEREETEAVLESLHTFLEEAVNAAQAPQQPGPGDSTDPAGGSS